MVSVAGIDVRVLPVGSCRGITHAKRRFRNQASANEATIAGDAAYWMRQPGFGIEESPTAPSSRASQDFKRRPS